MTQYGEMVAADVMARVVAYRKARKMSAAALAEGCTAAGHPISRAVLAGLETGRRLTLNVADVLAFAYVLDVPVLELLYGLDSLAEPSPLALPVGAEVPTAQLIGDAENAQLFGVLRRLSEAETYLLILSEDIERQSTPDPLEGLPGHGEAGREGWTADERAQFLALLRDRAKRAAVRAAELRFTFLALGVQPPVMSPEVASVYAATGLTPMVEALKQAPAKSDADKERMVQAFGDILRDTGLESSYRPYLGEPED